MTENKKTEKWSSLKLDLQQFTPQEFVAVCYYFVCIGNTSGRTKLTATDNKHATVLGTISHGKHDEKINPPITINEGWLWDWKGNEGNLNSNESVYYINYNGSYHVGKSNQLKETNAAS